MINKEIETRIKANNPKSQEVVSKKIKISPLSENYMKPSNFPEVDTEVVRLIMDSEILTDFERYFQCNQGSFVNDLLRGKVKEGFKPNDKTISVKASLYHILQSDFPDHIIKISDNNGHRAFFRCTLFPRKRGRKVRVRVFPASDSYKDIHKSITDELERRKKT